MHRHKELRKSRLNSILTRVVTSNWATKCEKKWVSAHKEMTQRQNALLIVTKKKLRAKSRSRLQTKSLDQLSERAKHTQSSPHSPPVIIDPDPSLQT